MRFHPTRPHAVRLTCVVALLVAAPALHAQVTEVARTSIADAVQLTFGSLCDDRFVIRNEGTEPVTLAYAVAKGTEHTTLTIGAREVVELESKSKQPLELWIDGKMIASATKERRACKKVQGNAQVSVAPLEVRTTDRDSRADFGRAFAGYPFYDPWAFGYFGALGFRPYGFGYWQRPIIIANVRGGGGRRGR